MDYIYTISYDEKEDEFYAWVFKKNSPFPNEPLYTIESTEEMVYYISQGYMKHIDDVEGLKDWLVTEKIINATDNLLLSEQIVW